MQKSLFFFFFLIGIAVQSQSLYLVESGDTFNSISKKFKMTVTEFLELNAYSKKDVLQIGTSVFVKYKKEETQTKLHIVQPKETLFSISKMYNLSVTKLKEINNLSDNKIKLGQRLVLISK